MDRAILLGNTPAVHYLQTKQIHHLCVCRLKHKKGKTESEILTAESFTWDGLLGIKRHSECIKDRQPYNHRNEVLVLRKHCDRDFIVRDITVTLNRCRGVELWGGSHGGWEGFCSPSSKNTHSSQPCGGILKPFGGAVQSCATKRHLNNTFKGAQA